MKDISLHILDIAQNSITAGARRLDLELSEADGWITLTVTDDGCGMSPELLARVCDPFTTTRTTRKMGLGIPLLRMSAEMTGGSLSIESTQGVGTRIQARFDGRHIDCPPLGDLADTIALLIQGAPELHTVYTHRREGQAITLDTDDLHAQLGGGISLAEPEVVLWLREYLKEQEESLNLYLPFGGYTEKDRG